MPLQQPRLDRALSAKSSLINFMSYLLGGLVLFIGYLPSFKVPVSGDDFYLQFEAQGRTNGNFGEWIQINFIGAITNGHFKPVGNFVDAIFEYFAYPLSATLGISTRYYFFIGGYIFFVLMVFSAVIAFKYLFELSSHSKVSTKYIFLIASIVTASTLQIHIWTNDPVTTYLPTGMGSAVLGFTVIGLTALILMRITSGKPYKVLTFITSTLGALAVLYYEMLVAAVIVQTFLYLFIFLRNKNMLRIKSFNLFVNYLLVAAVPAIVFLIGRVLSKFTETTNSYTGTQFDFGIAGFKTFSIALFSTFPGGAWHAITTRVPGINLTWKEFLAIGALGFVIGVLILLLFLTKSRQSVKFSNLILPSCAFLILGTLSIASQAFTPKYISEILDPSMVYLYYSIGSMCINMILVGFIYVLKVTRGIDWLGVGLIIGVTVFGILQGSLNWTLSNISEHAAGMNSELIESTVSTKATKFERCKTLEKWINSRDWPEYYVEGVTENSQRAYFLFHRKPFC